MKVQSKPPTGPGRAKAGIAVLLLAGTMAACGGGGGDDELVRMREAPATESPDTGSTDTASRPGVIGPINPAQLESPVSQAPVGRQTVREVPVAAGQDPNPPRHP